MCRWSSMAWTSFSGSVRRGNTSQRPSTIGIQTSTIWIVASFSNIAAGVSPDYVLTVCDNAKQSCPVFFGKAVRLYQAEAMEIARHRRRTFCGARTGHLTLHPRAAALPEIVRTPQQPIESRRG